MNDSELDELLRSANREVPVPASFRHSVWQRIESAALDEKRPLMWLERMITALARPAGAITAVSVFGLLGLWLGFASVRDQANIKLSYVESVSPFASAHK